MKIHRNSFGDLVVYDSAGNYKSMATKESDGTWVAVSVTDPSEKIPCLDEQHARAMAILMVGLEDKDNAPAR